MLDLSEEYDEENISTCVKYFKRMAAIDLWLEMEIGITGGEEDGVDNSGVNTEALYTKSEQVYNVYKALSAISPMFSIAAAFGNVHGVYKPGNVVLSPHLLKEHQQYVKDKDTLDQDKVNNECLEKQTLFLNILAPFPRNARGFRLKHRRNCNSSQKWSCKNEY